MKSFFAALTLLVLINFGTCAAETVHVTGRGTTERNAIHNALRLAIEQKFGAAVNAKTRVANSAVASDKIAVDSAGFVTRYEIISSRVVNGLYIVEVAAELDDKKNFRAERSRQESFG